MRLWHKDLIPVLPRRQLLGQWRELCLIAKEIHRKGTPNHLLVNKVTEYPPVHLLAYADLVANEMRHRNFKVNFMAFDRYLPELGESYYPTQAELFAGWHTPRYLGQCLFNLEEKYDCGGIPEDEWEKILRVFPKG